MLDTEDIKKLTEYQLEVFKDVFLTKEDGRIIKDKINQLQGSIGALTKVFKIKLRIWSKILANYCNI